MWNLNKIKQPQWQHESFSIPFGVVVQGDLVSEISGRIDGRVNGNVVSKGKLIVGDKAVIDGNVSAGQLIVFGTVNGNVEVISKVVLHNNACIRGSVIASVLEMDQTAIVKGLITKSKTMYVNGHASPSSDIAMPKKPAPVIPVSKKPATMPAANGMEGRHSRVMNGKANGKGNDGPERWF